MKPMLRVFLGTVVGMAALIGLGGAEAEPATNQPPASECAEDDPCWNCEEMGNRVCGARP